MEWSETEVFKIINLFSQFPCLWDFQSSSYKRLDKKRNAWDEISKNMGKTEDVVKKKIKNLRSAYLVEKKKVESCKKSGSAVDAIYVPHLYYYNEMRFLDRAICLRKTTSSLPEEESDIIKFSPVTELSQDSQDVEPYETYGSQMSFASETPTSDTPMSSKKASFSCKKRKADREKKINTALDAIISKTKDDSEKETMFSCFGKSIGLQLEKIPLNTAMETMVEIQKLLTVAVNKTDILEASMLAANIHTNGT